jgi:hypothetical protein
MKNKEKLKNPMKIFSVSELEKYFSGINGFVKG